MTFVTITAPAASDAAAAENRIRALAPGVIAALTGNEPVATE